MFRWHYFPFLRLTIYLSGGILIYNQFKGNDDLIDYLGLLAGTIILFFILSRSSSKLIKGVIAAIVLGIFGFILAWLNDPYSTENHLVHVDRPVKAYTGIINKIGEKRDKYVRYEVKVKKILTDSTERKSEGKIYLYVKDSLIRLSYGDFIRVNGDIRSIKPPGNPYEFDYKSFLEKKGIVGSTFTDPEAIEKTGKKVPNPLLKVAYDLRVKIYESFQAIIQDPRERQIALALTIGVKDDLSERTRQAYATAGAMHVLAVSGLHVGIIYLILSSILGKIFFTDRSKSIKLIIILLGIFFYAIVTGMSASVMRASVMFSVVAVGNTLYRASSVYNSLGIAAFILLLIDPNLIYSVGFQLSFSAVLGIVGLYPFISKWVNSTYQVINKLWQLTSVSIAAQLATLPFALYYFHQFPTYFFLSNIIVIPAAFVILSGGILMLILHSIPFPVYRYPAILYEKIIWLMNESIFMLEKLPNSLINWVYISEGEILCLYGALIGISVGSYYRSRTVFLGLLFFISFLMIGYVRQYFQLNQNGLFIYGADELVIDKISGKRSNILLIDQFDNGADDLSYSLNPLRMAMGLKPIEIELQDGNFFSGSGPLRYAQVDNYRFLYVTEEIENYVINKTLNTDFLILSPELKGDFDSILSKISFQKLLIQGSFPPWKKDELKVWCKEKGMRIHDLNEDGFLDLS